MPISGSVTRLSYTGCRGRAAVSLYRIANGSHTWPAEIDASRTLWESLELNPR
jgi:poly(3-hydroxybutyrate) depolymerase